MTVLLWVVGLVLAANVFYFGIVVFLGTIVRTVVQEYREHYRHIPKRSRARDRELWALMGDYAREHRLTRSAVVLDAVEYHLDRKTAPTQQEVAS